MEDFLSYFRQRLYYYRPFAHFERVPESYWTNFEKNLPPIVVEWLSWRPVIYTVYLFAILCKCNSFKTPSNYLAYVNNFLVIVIITYEIVSSLYYTGKAIIKVIKLSCLFKKRKKYSTELQLTVAVENILF